LGVLADALVAETDPVKVEELKERLVSGFYGP
jgi:hypothetical protein